MACSLGAFSRRPVESAAGSQGPAGQGKGLGAQKACFGVSPRSEMITVAFENQTKFAMSPIFSRNRFGKGLLIGGR
jgi:hypothetical protein